MQVPAYDFHFHFLLKIEVLYFDEIQFIIFLGFMLFLVLFFA